MELVFLKTCVTYYGEGLDSLFCLPLYRLPETVPQLQEMAQFRLVLISDSDRVYRPHRIDRQGHLTHTGFRTI